MDLLLKREQTRNLFGRVVFRLWAKTEMNEDERAIIDRYHLDESYLLWSDDRGHLKWAWIIGIITFVLVAGAVTRAESVEQGIPAGLLIGAIAGYLWLNEMRETIFMRDMIHGRRFKCRSIIDLAKRESRLEDACVGLRQVMETAKHWEGVETCPVPVLPKEEAKEFIVRAY